MKCIRSKFPMKDSETFEYLRVSNEEAEEQVRTKDWEYIPKSEYKRQSKYYKFVPNKGTLVNNRDAEGNNTQNVLNPSAYKTPKKGNSTKIADSSKNNRNITRTGKFQKPILTLDKIMRLPLKTFKEKDEVFESKQTEHEVCKARKNKMLTEFKRTV